MRLMRRAWSVSALASVAVLSAAGVARSDTRAHEDRVSAVSNGVFTDRVLVQFRSSEQLKAATSAGESAGLGDAAWSAFRSVRGVQSVSAVFDPPPQDDALAKRLGMDRWAIVWLPEGSDVRAIAQELASMRELIADVDLDANAESHTDPVTDPLFASQWHLQNIGQLVNGQRGTPGADIGVVGGWNAAPPLSSVVVAILDTGVSQSHPDLASVQVPGYNFASTDPLAYDDNTNTSHGTYCAGIAGAVWNNQTGGTGLGPNIRIMPVRVLQNISLGSQSTCATGLRWAADNGAKIISMSLGWGTASQTGPLSLAVQYAAGRNVVMCASVGNSPGSAVAYPAKWTEVIAVGGTDLNDGAWVGSTTGLEMDISAPADSILTTSDDLSGINGYSVQSGTSMACPMVAGAAALVLGTNPALTPADVRTILLTSARDLGTPGVDAMFGYGRLNVEAAVVAARRTLPCQPDFNRSGDITIDDLFDFLNAWFVGILSADTDQNGVISPADVFGFLDQWMAGCP